MPNPTIYGPITASVPVSHVRDCETPLSLAAPLPVEYTAARSDTSGAFVVSNNTGSPQIQQLTLEIEYGDGATDSREFELTVPAGGQSAVSFAPYYVYEGPTPGGGGLINGYVLIGFSHEFSEPGNPSARFRLSDNLGNISPWSTASNVAPYAVVEWTVDDEAVSGDATDSFDVDGTIATYSWNFGDGATATGITATHEYEEDGEYTVSLQVQDNDGAWSAFCSHEITIDSTKPSAFSDHDGVRFVAEKDGQDIVVREYKNGMPTETLRHTLENHKNPSIYQHKNDSVIYLAATDSSDGQRRLYESPDYAVSFNEVVG